MMKGVSATTRYLFQRARRVNVNAIAGMEEVAVDLNS